MHTFVSVTSLFLVIQSCYKLQFSILREGKSRNICLGLIISTPPPATWDFKWPQPATTELSEIRNTVASFVVRWIDVIWPFTVFRWLNHICLKEAIKFEFADIRKVQQAGWMAKWMSDWNSRGSRVSVHSHLKFLIDLQPVASDLAVASTLQDKSVPYFPKVFFNNRDALF